MSAGLFTSLAGRNNRQSERKRRRIFRQKAAESHRRRLIVVVSFCSARLRLSSRLQFSSSPQCRAVTSAPTLGSCSRGSIYWILRRPLGRMLSASLSLTRALAARDRPSGARARRGVTLWRDTARAAAARGEQYNTHTHTENYRKQAGGKNARGHTGDKYTTSFGLKHRSYLSQVRDSEINSRKLILI